MLQENCSCLSTVVVDVTSLKKCGNLLKCSSILLYLSHIKASHGAEVNICMKSPVVLP